MVRMCWKLAMELPGVARVGGEKWSASLFMLNWIMLEVL